MCCVVGRRKVVSISRPTGPSGRDERGGGRSTHKRETPKKGKSTKK